MRFSAYITFIIYIVTLVGLISLSLIEELSPWFLLFIWVATLSSLFVKERAGRLVSPNVWNALAVVLFLAFLVDYLLLSSSLVGSAARFLSILCVLKLYDLRTTRDYLILYIIVFFELLAASASTTSPAFFGVIFLFIIATIWALIVFNIKRDTSEHHLIEPPHGLFGRLFLAGTVALTVLSLLITLVLFFIIPRMEFHLFESKSLNTVKVSGFSDTVELGSIGTVKLESTVVMRVETTATPPVYIRGGVLDLYEEGTWKRTELERHLVKRHARGVFLSGLVARRGMTLYRIMLEPLDTDILLVPPRWIRIEGNFTGIWADPTGTLYLPSPPLRRIEYTIWASRDATVVTEGAGLSSYLKVPSGYGRVAELAESITEGLTTPEEKAMAIEKYLEKNYRYSLSIETTDELKEPIDAFLFDTREGWCEQFATSMVLMLRTLGIPARLVTGFAGGEWNPFGNYYIFRQKDAHTWVEAYIEGTGWMRFDPTPAQEVLVPPRTSSLALYIDALHWRWYRYIIGYSFADQIRLARSVETGMGRARQSFLKSLKGLKTEGTLVAGILVSALIILLLIFVVAARRERKNRLPESLWFYREMVRILAKRGIERLPQETPAEFATRVGMPEVKGLTEIFQRARYGGKRLTQDELKRVEKLLDSLRKRG